MTRTGGQPDDRAMRLYLLGKMTQAQRDQLQEQMFADDSSYDRLLEAEHDLIDDYVRGKLSAQEARDVEAGLLASREHLDSTRFAQALWRVGKTRKTSASLTRRASAQQWAIAAGVAVLALGSATWMAVQNVKLRSDLAALQQQHSTIPAPRVETPQSQGAPAIASLTLVPQLRGATTNTVRIRPTAGLVKVELADARGFDNYSVRVERAGQIVWASRGLKLSAAGSVNVWVPADVLPSGDYEFLLYGDAGGREKLAGSYSSRIEAR